MGHQRRVSELHFVAVVKHSIHFRRLVEGAGRIAVTKIALAASFDLRHVGVHYHVVRTGQLLDERAPRAVVPMGMADQQDLDIVKMESQLLNALANQRDARLETAVDEDVAPGGGDQVGGKSAAPDVIDVADHAEWRKRLSPGRAALRQEAAGEGQQEDHRAEESRQGFCTRVGSTKRLHVWAYIKSGSTKTYRALPFCG